MEVRALPGVLKMADTPYIVLARKHRPRHFDDVVGQDHIARTLRNALTQNRVAHALLFSGPRGVGKTSTARILARALNCQTGPAPTPCDECGSCREIYSGSSVDVIEIDAASNRGIDEIRELRDAVRYPPSRERYKVYIIDEVHMLTTPAFNALLKTLEEPPPHVVFIFATTEPHKIPDTILSRCQRYDFRRISPEDIEAHLTAILAAEGLEAERSAMRMIAQQSEGCMRDAQSQLDQLINFSDGVITGELASRVLGVVGEDALFQLTESLLLREIDGVLSVVEDAYRVGVNLVRFASDLLEHLRDLTICSVAKGDSGLSRFSEARRERLRAQAAHADVSVLHRMFKVLYEGAGEMSRSAYPRLVLEMTLVRMATIEPVAPIAELVARIEALASSAAAVIHPAMTSAAEKPSVSRRDAPAATKPQSTAVEPTPATAVRPAPPEGARAADTPPPIAAKAAGQGTDSRTQIEKWNTLVSAVTQRYRTLGGMLRVAELEEGDGDKFAIKLTGAQYDIIDTPEKMKLVNETAVELFGPSAQVVVEQRQSDDSSERFSIVGAEAAAAERERERLAKLIVGHQATALIKDVFKPTSVKISPREVSQDPSEETDP